MNLEELKVVDADVAAAIEAEMDRQNSHIELIASENWVSDAVMEAQGSIMTNKYAEGYPGKRYYGGCQCVDVVENLAIERAKELFDAEYVNVQPHSGAQANMAVQFALLQPGDTVMGMNLDHGGHLTHGSPVNFSGTYFHIVPYGVNDEGFIDYDKVEEIAMECKPKMIIAGASAYARTIDFPRFREIADKCGAYLMVDMAHIAGLVAAGLHPSPIHYADVVTRSTISSSLSFGMTINVSTFFFNSSIPEVALFIRLLASKRNGLVTIPAVRMPISLAIPAMTGAAPVPVPPPIPQVTNTISAPFTSSVSSSLFSSAAALPTSGSAPAPNPLVSFSPI